MTRHSLEGRDLKGDSTIGVSCSEDSIRRKIRCHVFLYFSLRLR